ncbi:MAG TPA: two-component system response regulator [Polyangiaceae bacterium]|nr:two-component system response regulator [Polyangiaceae bacterium]
MTSSPAKPVILIVDDAPESIDVLRGVLGAEYQVKAAIHGAIALELVQATPPDLILLDVMMPEMNGFEVCERLKASPLTAHIPVIFVTTLGDAGSEGRGLELGAVDYLTKPYVPALVRSRVRSHLALYHRHLSLEQEVHARTRELTETRLEIIRRLGRAGEYRDNETGMHVLRMSHIARVLALRLGMSEAQGDLVLQAAPMHDVGKLGIPDRILLKPGKLTPEEWEIMKQHTVIGAEIVGDHPSELMQTARMVALRHHERWDGSGYPHGLSGEANPAIARLVAVADVFDALLSARPYKKPWTVAATIEEFKAQSGRHFEPAAVSALLDMLPQCLAIRDQYRDADSDRV